MRPTPIRVLVGEPISTAGLTMHEREALRVRARAAVEALRARVDAAPALP
jgi:hypothetical protein